MLTAFGDHICLLVEERQELQVHILHVPCDLSYTRSAIHCLACRSQTYTTPLREIVPYPDNYFSFLYFLDQCYISGTLHNSGGQRDESLKNLKCGLLKTGWHLFLDQLQGSRLVFYKPWYLTVNILLPRIFLGDLPQFIEWNFKPHWKGIRQSSTPIYRKQSQLWIQIRLLRALSGKTWKISRTDIPQPC